MRGLCGNVSTSFSCCTGISPPHGWVSRLYVILAGYTCRWLWLPIVDMWTVLEISSTGWRSHSFPQVKNWSINQSIYLTFYLPAKSSTYLYVYWSVSTSLCLPVCVYQSVSSALDPPHEPWRTDVTDCLVLVGSWGSEKPPNFQFLCAIAG